MASQRSIVKTEKNLPAFASLFDSAQKNQGPLQFLRNEIDLPKKPSYIKVDTTKSNLTDSNEN